MGKQPDITRVLIGHHTFGGKRTGLKGRSAHVGFSHGHRRHGSEIGPVVAAVVATVPLQSGDATVVPDHHAASLVLGFDSGSILLSPARGRARQCVDCSVCGDMSVGNWYIIWSLVGNGRLVFVGGLLGSLDLGKDGHVGSRDGTQEIGASVVVEQEWHEGKSKSEKVLNILLMSVGRVPDVPRRNYLVDVSNLEVYHARKWTVIVD